MKRGEKKGIWYTNKDYKHNENETTYASKRKEFLMSWLVKNTITGFSSLHCSTH
jgi:hypothetical protein